MKDENKTKKQLIKELTELRKQIHNEENLGIGSKQTVEWVESIIHRNELILNAAGEGILSLDINGRHIFANPAAAQMLGYTINELIGKQSHALLHYKKTDGSLFPEEECPIYAAYKDGKVHHKDDEVFWRKDRTCFPVEYTSTPVIEGGDIVGAVITFMDITERKRIEESLKLDEERLETLLTLSQLKIKSENDITDFALEEGVRLTRSKGGYLHFFNEDEQTIQLYSWSKDVLKVCTAEQGHNYPLDTAGVWADSIRTRGTVIHNDYQSISHKKGYPEGHFHLIRHMGIPIFDEDRIVGVTGVGNKEEPYEDSDARQLTLLMNSMWGILKQKRSEQERERLIRELKDALAKVKTLSGLLPICASCKKVRDDKGYWTQIEAFISEHSEAEFSHGICAECAKKLYPEYYNEMKLKKRK
jgi:PAS domain S-box-containing protein